MTFVGIFSLNKQMKKLKESQIQKQILDYLLYKKYLVWKNNNVGIFKKATGQYIPSPSLGVSDIIGCTKEGKLLCIEVKRNNGKLTENQKNFLEAVNKHGGIGFVARSVENVMEQLNEK